MKPTRWHAQLFRKPNYTRWALQISFREALEHGLFWTEPWCRAWTCPAAWIEHSNKHSEKFWKIRWWWIPKFKLIDSHLWKDQVLNPNTKIMKIPRTIGKNWLSGNLTFFYFLLSLTKLGFDWLNSTENGVISCYEAKLGNSNYFCNKISGYGILKFQQWMNMRVWNTSFIIYSSSSFIIAAVLLSSRTHKNPPENTKLNMTC